MAGSRQSSHARDRRQGDVDSFTKLDPRIQIRNPVMFVVEVGVGHHHRHRLHQPSTATASRSGSPATIARLAVADGAVRQLRGGDRRGPRQGPGRRAARDAHHHHGAAAATDGSSSRCRRPSCARRRRGGRGGRADPRRWRRDRGRRLGGRVAITGESAPVIRESGGDRSAVTGGTRLLSDRLVVEVTQEPGQSFLDRMIAPGGGRRAAKDAERDRAQHPAGGADARSSWWPWSPCSRSRSTPTAASRPPC